MFGYRVAVEGETSSSEGRGGGVFIDKIQAADGRTGPDGKASGKAGWQSERMGKERKRRKRRKVQTPQTWKLQGTVDPCAYGVCVHKNTTGHCGVLRTCTRGRTCRTGNVLVAEGQGGVRSGDQEEGAGANLSTA